MRRSLILSLPLAVSLLAQQPTEGYLDLFMVKVKPERRLVFDAVVKKLAEANRQQKGDQWLASEINYGEQNTIFFTSTRNSYGEVEKGMEAFMGSVMKAHGEAGTGKLMAEFNTTVSSTRGEIRRRRPDLSSNLPSDLGGILKLVGSSRWLRTTVIRVRPGHTGTYTEALRSIKAARERSARDVTVFVSQSASGQQGTVFYATQLVGSLGALDAAPPLDKLLGSSFNDFLQKTQQAVLSTETYISRYVPELSNPPDEVVAAAPDFWRPKPKAAPKAKPKAEAPTP